jgi:hypothetical protein
MGMPGTKVLNRISLKLSVQSVTGCDEIKLLYWINTWEMRGGFRYNAELFQILQGRAGSLGTGEGE